jgi:signal transduction histidine kinase
MSRYNNSENRKCGVPLWLLMAVLVAYAASGATPSRVLLLHSFGRDFAPFDAFSASFRSELAQRLGGAVVFYDVNLEIARFDGGEPEVPFINYLETLFASNRLDLIVPIGGPAARFAQAHRDRFFAGTPMLLAAVDERHLNSAAFSDNDTVVSCFLDPASLMRSVLEVLPATTNVAVVVGNSPLEKFWLEELRRNVQPFTNRVSFSWFNTLSFAEMKKRVSSLPPHSAIFYFVLSVDAEGVPHFGKEALSSLHEVANAPMFGLHQTQLGFIVGGPLLDIEELSRNTAGVAVRILHGEPAGSIKTPTQGAGKPIYDWRELKRWGISEENLPAGSAVWFRERSIWDIYKWRILLGVATACAAIGAVYYSHVARLQATQRAQAAFTRELILSQENERKRIAGELHDGLGQDLLVIKNRLGLLAVTAKHEPEVARQLGELSATTSRTIGEVRSISQGLRPVALEQVGLTKAIDWMIEQIGEASATKFTSEIDNLDGVLAPDLEINLYRIVQEALNNVIKHAKATVVMVEAKREPGQMTVSILDNGRGFDSNDQAAERSRQGRKATLGLAGMTERAKLLDGDLQIQSAPGTGTKVMLTVPLRQAGL